MIDSVANSLVSGFLRSCLEETRRTYDLVGARYHELFHDELAGKPYDRALLEKFAMQCGPSAMVLDAGRQDTLADT
jgi:hypothetical protein